GGRAQHAYLVAVVDVGPAAHHGQQARGHLLLFDVRAEKARRPGRIVVAEEGGGDGVLRQALLQQPRYVTVTRAGFLHVGAEYLLDVAALLGDGEEEETVDVRLAVVGYLIEVRPGLAHEVAVGAYAPRRLAEPVEESDVLFRAARVVARHGVEPEAVHADVLQIGRASCRKRELTSELELSRKHIKSALN